LGQKTLLRILWTKNTPSVADKKRGIPFCIFTAPENIFRRSDDPASGTPSVRDLYLGVYGALGGFSAISIMTSSLFVAVGGLNASRSEL
jgi:hypothetical protein